MKKRNLVFAALCGMAALTQATLAQAAQPAGTEQRPTGGSFTAPPPDRVPMCTRATLQAAVDSYLDAQRTAIRRRALAGNVRIPAGHGARRSLAGDCGTSRSSSRPPTSVLDPVRCKTFTEIVVTEGTPLHHRHAPVCG